MLQHLLLLPFLLVSYWASLRIQWRPVLVAIPLQLILGLVFAAIAYPAMIIGEIAVGDAALARADDVARGKSLDGPHGHVAVARELRELPADLRLRPRPGDRVGAVHAVSQFRAQARGARARVERRAPGGAAHAVVAAHAVQSAAHHPRPHRMGSERQRRPWSCSSRICCAGC